jgi:sporulation protein YlmC with PRC-barrel domain
LDLAQGIYIAGLDAEDRSLRRYAGQKLYNSEGAELGTIKDFIVDPVASGVRYFVVSSGGILGGMGNSLRLVPIEALRREPKHNRFEVDILQARWLQIPPIHDEDYVVDRFNISPAQHQELVQQLGGSNILSQPAPSTPASPGQLTGLIRATQFRGKSVQAAGQRVGNIENIIVDLAGRTAAVLVDSAGDFTGTRAKYLVPLHRLAFTSPRREAVTTTLTRADFDRAQPATFQPDVTTARFAPARGTDEPQLTPTGPTTPAVPPTARVSESLAASARAVRQAFDSDATLADANVQVTAENGNVVLRGTVRNPTIRDELERTAKRVAPAAPIDSQITINNR